MRIVEGALGAMSSCLFGLGAILLFYFWLVDVIFLQYGIRSGSSTIVATYGVVPVLELAAVAMTVLGTRESTGQTRWGRRRHATKLIWLCNVLNVVLAIPMAPALIFPPPSTGGTGPAYATSVLVDSLPDPSTGTTHDPYGALDQFTASELNRIHWHFELGHVEYVPANVPSTDPEIVSVNPIDTNTWGAAAYSVRAQRCYLILFARDVTNPRYGATYYGRLAAGASCVGAAATRDTVTSTTSSPE